METDGCDATHVDIVKIRERYRIGRPGATDRNWVVRAGSVDLIYVIAVTEFDADVREPGKLRGINAENEPVIIAEIGAIEKEVGTGIRSCNTFATLAAGGAIVDAHDFITDQRRYIGVVEVGLDEGTAKLSRIHHAYVIDIGRFFIDQGTLGFRNEFIDLDPVDQHRGLVHVGPIGNTHFRTVGPTQVTADRDIQDQVVILEEFLHGVAINRTGEITNIVDLADDGILIPFDFKDMVIVS